MRTQGRRPDNLREALTCLAGQTNSDFDVLLMVHTDDAQPVAAVEARAPRVSLVLKADIRPGVSGALTAKVESVERRLSGG